MEYFYSEAIASNFRPLSLGVICEAERNRGLKLICIDHHLKNHTIYTCTDANQKSFVTLKQI